MILNKPKADIAPFFNNIIKKIAPLGCLTLAASSDLTNEILFAPFCGLNKVKVGSFLIEVLNKIPTTEDTLGLRWSLLCAIGSLSRITRKTKNKDKVPEDIYLISKVQNDFSAEMALSDFSSLKDAITKQILPYMSKSHNKINDKIAHNISFYLVLLRDEKPGIFYSILPLLKDLFTNVRYPRIFKAIGIEIISFFQTSPIDFFSTLGSSFCEEKDIPSLFSYSINFLSIEFTHYLQSTLILGRYPYPTPFYGSMNNSMYCSLLNSSIEKHQYILDLINEVLLESLVNADIESVMKSTCMFPELLPYLLIVYQNMLYGDLESFVELLETTYPPSRASDVICRFKNDFHLTQLMTMLTGSNFSPGELLENSIPFHLMSNNTLVKKTDDILAASKYKYFLLSDTEAESDFDFIRSMAAFRIIMNIIKKPIHGQVLKDQLEKMYNYISSLQNAVSHINLIIDIFSLIFLTNKKDNSYACTPYIAYKISETLAKFNSNDYIIGTYELFMKKKPKKSEQSLDPYFEQDTSTFYNAIEKHEWEAAEKLTILFPYYKKLYSRAYDAYRYMNEGIEPWKSPDLIKLNVGLSDFGYRNELKTLEPQFPNYAPILEERIRSQDSTNPIPTSDQWNPVAVFVNMFDTSSLDMVKKIPDFLGTLTISKSLYKFLDEIWVYYSCAKCGNYFHANGIEDLFVFDIYKALAGPVEVGEYQKAIQLSEEAKIDLIPFIFDNLHFFKSFDESFIDKMHESYPAATNALLLTLIHPYLIKNQTKKESEFEDEEKIHDEDFRKLYRNIVEKNDRLNKVSQYLSLFEAESSSESKEPVNSNGSLINRIIMSSNDDNLIDDLIYTVDHNEIYDSLMTRGNYSEEKLATSLYNVFNIVSYVAPDSDKEKVDRINVRHKIRQFSSAKIPAEIIRDVMINNEFDLALHYLKTCVPSAETASPLCQLFTSALAQSEKSQIKEVQAKGGINKKIISSTSLAFVDDILSSFPERFDIILSRFFHIPGIIKTLSKYAPDDKKVYMKGLSHLPELIFSDSNIFSIDTIVDSYIRNYQYIFEINPEIANLFDDDKLFSMIKGVHDNLLLQQDLNPRIDDNHNLENISTFNDVCVYLYSFFKDKNILVNYWISYVEDSLSKFNIINSSQIEWNLNYYMQKIQIPLRLFISNLKSKESSESLSLDIIKLVTLLVSYFPFSKLGIIYNFKNCKLNSPDFGQNIISISTKIDEDHLVRELAKSFEFNLDLYFLQKVKTLFELSKYEEGFKMLGENKLRIDKYDQKVQLFDTSYSFLTPLNKLHFFLQKDLNLASDPAKLKEGSPQNKTMTIYSNLKQKVNEMRKMRHHLQNMKLVDDKVTRLMHNIIQQYCRKDAAISMLISFKQFESAYMLLMKEKDDNERSKLFIHSFFISVQFNNTNDILKKFLNEKDPNLDQTSKLWIKSINFFKKKSMLYSLDFVYTIRNQLDDASLMEVELFKNCVSFEKQVHLLGQIIYNLETSLNFRKNPCSHSPPFIKNESISTHDLQILMEKSILQLNICSLWIERGIPFSHDLDIISSMESATSVAAILYLNNSQELLREISKLAEISAKDITSKVCEVLSNEPINKIIEFWNNLKKHKATLGPSVPYELLKTLAMSSNRKIVQTIIISFFSSNEEKCKLLLEYDYIAEAYMIAYQDPNLISLKPLIGKRAALLGNLSIYNNCVSDLSKKRK